MRKSSLPVSFKTLVRYTEENILDFESPIQRKSNQWNILQKSMLIHSILADYIVPSIYLIKNDDKKLSVIDGKQRLTSVLDFVNNLYSLHSKVPSVELNGVSYEIKNKYFKDLPDDVKAEIVQYRFQTYQLEECTTKDVEEIFSRLNGGTSLSKIQLARPKMGVELAEFFNRMNSSDFMQKSINLTYSQLRHEDDYLMLITFAMILDEVYYRDFKINSSASASECLRFSEYIKDNYSSEKREEIENVIEYLGEAYKDVECKYLRKNNLPIVMYLGLLCANNDIDSYEFKYVMDSFFDGNESKGYLENSGSGNVKMIKVKNRIVELYNYMQKRLANPLPEEINMVIPYLNNERG